ncbi:NUDIX hydrolase [Bacillus aquiflavi]|uniref:NUDIX hydrolase n=1 Tax=Bacillus aquiflavi TaxID=2672567 RepID=A0A6B3W591_9BACI|nr:NUDIX domain-containing protein [Bacillus aquiflavi]MBA4538782.1 NUDIX hydrolase [Bacillus aquiflavi]NEY83133.1 NUDIX hydrolase [Bacillus aquiflavi]UAC49955.1 NUDIX hydrolase [Bacillus aquiflavi]
MKKNEEALKYYDLNKYRTPDGYTSDIAVFTIVDDEEDQNKKVLKLMLIKRSEIDAEGNPNIEGGKWALPGGFVRNDETAFEAAKRELAEETGVDHIHLKHFGVYDKPGRDPRGWIIANAHYAIVNEYYLEHRQAADDADDVQLFTLDEVFNLDLAFDHRKIIEDSIKWIKKDMAETTLARTFLPREFTIPELQKVILAVFYHKQIESNNFYKKLHKFDFIEEVKGENNEVKETRRNSKRPAKMYRFVDKERFVSIYL